MKNSVYDISIIIPVYNAEKYLSQCLDSCLSQNIKNYEIICVNDGSTDSSLKILKKYQKISKNIKVITQKNSGQGSARNNAIKKAKGEYIMFVDADDFIADNFLGRWLKEAKKNNADIYFSKNLFIGANNNYKIWHSPYEISINNPTKDYVLNVAGPVSKLIKTSLLRNNNINFKEGIIYEDIAIIPALALFAKKIVRTSDAIYYYREVSTSSTRDNHGKRNHQDIIPAINEMNNYFKKSANRHDLSNEQEYVNIRHLLIETSLRSINSSGLKHIVNNSIAQLDNTFSNWQKNIYLDRLPKKAKIIYKLLSHRHIYLVRFILSTSKLAKRS